MFDIDEITQTGWFRFMEKIVNIGYEFVFYAFFNRKPMKRFKCGSDV